MKTLMLLAVLSAALATATAAHSAGRFQSDYIESETAGTLPIAGIYGNDRGCSLYKKGGFDAVYTDGLTIEDTVPWNYQEPIVARHTDIVGLELLCVPQGDTLGAVHCESSDMNGDMSFTLALDEATDTLSIDPAWGELHRCLTAESPLM